MPGKRGHQSNGDAKPPSQRSLGTWAAVAIAVVLLLYLGTIELSRPHVGGERLRLDGFLNLVDAGRVRDATILDQDSYVIGKYRGSDGAVHAYNVPYIKSQSNNRERLVERLTTNRVPTRIDQQIGKTLAAPATLILPALIFVIVFAYFLLSMRNESGPFRIRSGARRFGAGEADVTFADVAGQDAAVAELREVSHFLADTGRYAAVGAQIPRGILLFGPPGCGKTLMARALAGEAGAAFYSISGSDFVEMYVGVGAARVRQLFQEARANAPAIVFIDELDSVGRRRMAAGPAVSGGSAEEQGQALNQLLAEIDGFSPTAGVMVVAATNRPDVLDPALLRPGRFDRAVGLELPGEQGRLEVLQVHARGKPLDPSTDLALIAERAVGMTGADLAGLVNEASLLAARAGRQAIIERDLLDALERIREAPERQRRLAIRDRRIGQHLLESERVTFDDVAGLESAIEELAEVHEYLADPARFERLGAQVPSGYLLSGPPGTGKTLLARALAGETNAAYVAATGTEFVEQFLGEGAARMRDLFAQARSVAPTIVFIDELDAIGATRGASGSDDSERAQTLNQLLVELDGFERGSVVIVVAATNRPELLDPALTRPGRFDRMIALDLPDLDLRLKILQLHVRGKPMGTDVDLGAVARLTQGMSAAQLAQVVNEAALLAARRGRDNISNALIEEALDRSGMGIAGGRVLTDEIREVVAYHEAGHGLVARALPGGRILHKITIVSRGSVLGVTWLPESDDQLLHQRSVLIERMATLLGGRVAEQLVFGESSDGAASDLAQVGAIARRMVAQLGMSDQLGAVNYLEGVAADGGAQYSDETGRMIDAELRRVVAEAERLARGVLSSARADLDRVAQALLERETLTLDDIDAITGPLAAAR
jgi:cell division protease FtsH